MTKHAFGELLRASAERFEELKTVSLTISMGQTDLHPAAFVADDLDFRPNWSRLHPMLIGFDACVGQVRSIERIP